jgi:UDP-glucuronate 4-epimerase
MNILVTGGAGFIGSHLTERLLVLGHRVSVIDNFDRFYEPEIKEKNLARSQEFEGFRLWRADIQNRRELEQIFDKGQFEFVFHLAAKAGVRPSIADPAGYYRVNVEGTLNLLELCRTNGIMKFILASTSSIYGNNRKVPFSETDPVDNPISPYAATKKSAELICHTYHYLYGMDIFALRFFTVYGPRQRPDLAIHKFFRLIDRDAPIPFYGDGTTSRDYTYIDDILQGLVNCIDRVSGFEIINIGESRTITLDGLVKAIEKTIGKKARRNKLPMQPGDVDRTFADIEKARQILDYNPQTEFHHGLQYFYQWFREAC